MLSPSTNGYTNKNNIRVARQESYHLNIDLKQSRDEEINLKSTLRDKPWVLALFCLMALEPTFANASSTSEPCVLTMGYRTSERLPYIEQEPSNAGLYHDIYQAAVAKIGCQLKIIRTPKLRVLRDLKLGKIDFYPGLSFTDDRAQFTHFIPNGLSERVIGVSRAGAADILSLEQLSHSQMTLLIAPGSYDFGGLPQNMRIRKPPELDVAKALDYLLNNQGDFFIYDQETIT